VDTAPVRSITLKAPPARKTRKMLFARALLAFLVLPGIVAFLVPALLVPQTATRTFDPLGFAPFIAGIVVLLWCVRDFYVAGKGTLAPWDSPRHLYESGCIASHATRCTSGSC
jgi:hypothetical protein